MTRAISPELFFWCLFPSTRIPRGCVFFFVFFFGGGGGGGVCDCGDLCGEPSRLGL